MLKRLQPVVQMKFLSKYWRVIISIFIALWAMNAAYSEGRKSGIKDKVSIKRELVEAKLEIGRGRTLIVSRDLLIAKLTEFNKSIKKDLDESNSEIIAIAELIAKNRSSGSGKARIIVREVLTHSPSPDTPEYALDPDFEGILDCNECCGSFGYSDFRLDWVFNSCTQAFDYHLAQTFRARMVEAKDSDGNVSSYIQLEELDDKAKVISTLDIEEFVVVKIDNQLFPSFNWLTPHVDFGLVSSISIPFLETNVGPSVGFSLSGYGITENDQEYRFARVSLDFSDGIALGISPVGVNLSKFKIPLVSDLWLWPTYEFDGHHFIGLTLSTTL